MNYQEIVNAQHNMMTHQETLPFGKFYKKQIDNKYRFVIDLKGDLSDSIVFCEALKKDQGWTASHQARQQVQFALESDEKGIHSLILEQGNFQTLEQLLFDEPAVIAGKGFVEQFLNNLFDITEKLHAEGIYHLCYSPKNIFVRKGDTTPLLLCHGSFYTGVNDVHSLYAGTEEYLAPEVLSRQGIDERSDVYGIGKIIGYLFAQSSIPFEYKQLVKKATDTDPDKRYKSIQKMRNELTAKRSMRRSVFALVAAVVLAFLCIWLYLDLVPQTEYIEFVEPAPKEVSDDPFENGQFDPEMGLLMADDSIPMTEQDKEYRAKVEEIYRKRMQAATEATFSKVYDKKRMRSTEKKFVAGNQRMMEELMEEQTQLAAEMGIDAERASAIAEEVIGHVMAERQKDMTRNGYQKGEE